MTLKKIVLISCSFVICMNGLLFSQIEILDKYRKDEPVKTIFVETPQIEGRTENGKLFLSESEAVRMALVNNLDINVERYNSLKGAWDIAASQSSYDPQGTFGFNWNRRKNPTESVLQGGPSVTDILTDYTFGFVQPFATGTNLEVNFLGNRNRTTNFFSSLIPAVRTQFDFLLRQDLLQGFGKRDAEYEIEISQNALDITTEDFRESVIDTVVQVQDWFWELEYSLNDIDVRRKALEYAKTVLEQNGARFEVGTAARLEVVEAEAEVASRNEELIRAQFTYRRVQDQLVRLITNYEDPRIFLAEIVPDSALKPFDKEEESFEKLMDLAGELRPEIQRADLDIKKFNLRLRQSRDKLKPKLGLVAGYQWYGLGGTEIVRDYSLGFFDAPVVAVNPGGLWDSMGQLVSGDFNGYVVGLTLDLPIQNLAARASNAKAQLDLRRAKTEKSATRQRIALEIRDALTQLQMNEATLNAAKVAVRAAQERLLGEEARFEVGMGTTRELIEAQRDLLQAKSLEVRAQTDLKKSHSILDKAVGRTLIRQNIRIKEALDLNVKDTGD